MKKFEIGQFVCSAISKDSEPVVIEKEYHDEYSDMWYFGITYKNEFRYVPQSILKLFGNKVLCRERLPKVAGKYYTNIGVFDYSGPIMVPNGIPATEYILKNEGVWGHNTQLNLIAMCFPIWWIEQVSE